MLSIIRGCSLGLCRIKLKLFMGDAYGLQMHCLSVYYHIHKMHLVTNFHCVLHVPWWLEPIGIGMFYVNCIHNVFEVYNAFGIISKPESCED